MTNEEQNAGTFQFRDAQKIDARYKLEEAFLCVAVRCAEAKE